MSEQQEIYITSATRENPDGTIEQLSHEEAQSLLVSSDDATRIIFSSGIVSVDWIEATPEQFLAMHGIDLS